VPARLGLRLVHARCRRRARLAAAREADHGCRAPGLAPPRRGARRPPRLRRARRAALVSARRACYQPGLDQHPRAVPLLEPDGSSGSHHRPMLIRIVSILSPMFAIAALGFVIGRRTRPDLGYINKLNMDVFVPALISAALASEDFRIREFAPLAAAAFAVIAGSGVI